jgi:Cu(I)/Ag(I) efflux system membrane fusion protein
MFKRITIFTGGAFFLALSLFFLVSCSERAQKAVLDADMIGRKALCPVTGDTFTIHGSTPVVVYKSDKYYMCCPGCDVDFIKDPEKYLKEMRKKGEASDTLVPEAGNVSYWTCSMHPEVRSETEGNCPICSMILIPVYEKSESNNSLHLTNNGMALAGIRTIPVKREHLHREMRLVGTVAFDPELVTAQEEYINALEMREGIGSTDVVARNRAEQLISYADYRLKLLGMDEAEISALARVRKKQLSLVIPQNESWVYADAYESDIGWIEKGQEVIVTSTAFPGEQFHGKVVSVNPTLKRNTRSGQIRIRLSNPESKLKPGMYVETRIMAPVYLPEAKTRQTPLLAIPAEAVLDTGKRKVVWVYAGEGYFEPREVRIGPEGYAHGRSSGVRYYPVLEGLREGELVVTNGNFLIDSESRITGVAAMGYGGALGVEEQEMPIHQH